jgi:hypothetical protein
MNKIKINDKNIVISNTLYEIADSYHYRLQFIKKNKPTSIKELNELEKISILKSNIHFLNVSYNSDVEALITKYD